MKSSINYAVAILTILITIIISCSTSNENDISDEQFFGMWRINDNNDILHFGKNNIWILTDWTCYEVLDRGNWEVNKAYSMLRINDSLLFKINSIEYDKIVINNRDTIFRVHNLNPKE